VKIVLLSEERVRLEGTAGPLSVEAESPERSYSPFHMVASGLATCVFSVLHSWASNADLSVDDLSIEVGWSFADSPHRVGEYELELIWPSLPPQRRVAAERASHLCPIHQTLRTPPEIRTRVRE
jgi:putative redox protein